MNTTGRELEVVVLGRATVELRADEPLDRASTFHREVGGDASLTAVAAARAGATTALATHVGDDPFGRWLIEQWEREDLHLDFTREVARPNGLELVGGAGRRFSPLPAGQTAGASLAPEEVASIPWDLTRLLMVGGPAQAAGPEARAAVARAAAEAHAAGVTVVYDAALSPALWAHAGDRAPRRALEELIPALDVLVVDAPYGAGRLLGQPTPRDAIEAARALGIPRVVVRESPHRRRLPGGEGEQIASTLACWVADGQPDVAPHRVEVPGGEEAADATRRRATFDGVLAAALAHGRSLPEAASSALEATQLPLDAHRLPSPEALRALLASRG